MATGAFCISIDLELAWGLWDRPSASYDRLCAEKERPIVRRLLELFARHEIPATWAVVGRLLDRAGGPPVPSELGDAIWYAPDLVDAIRAAPPGHDIGSHSFAHVYFRQSDREALRADLRAAREVHDRHGLPFTSFVFPRNQVNHLDLLAEAGVKVFRTGDASWHMAARERLGTVPGRAASLVDQVFPIPPPVVRPTALPNGLVQLPSSMLLIGRAGWRRLVRPEVTEVKAKLGLLRAARTGGLYHLWFHPANFYWDTDVELRVLDAILRAACAMRDRGELEIRTMASYARDGASTQRAGRAPANQGVRA